MKKNILYFLAMLLMAMPLASCVDDSADNPTFSPDEMPYIYTDIGASTSTVAGVETTIPVLVSPSDGSVKVVWTLDGVEIGTNPTLVYTFPKAGTFKLRISVERNGISNHREFTLSVSNP